MKPCPFCGARLLKEGNGYIHPKWTGGEERSCLLAGSHHFGAMLAPLWEQRGPLVWYTVVDGYPQFNVVGVGKPVVTASQLQTFFDYVKGA